MNPVFTTYCKISDGKVFIDGETVFEQQESDMEFLKELYKYLQIDHPKFYKMDELSQLGFIGIEFLKKERPDLNEYQDDEIAIVFQNEKSCLQSDVNHQQQVNRKSPSPAVFVYTLPNIVIGEISIFNKWYGESAFFIGKQDDLKDLLAYAKSLLLTGKAKLCILGLVESFQDEQYLKLVVAEKKKSGKSVSTDNLLVIFGE